MVPPSFNAQAINPSPRNHTDPRDPDQSSQLHYVLHEGTYVYYRESRILNSSNRPLIRNAMVITDHSNERLHGGNGTYF